MKIGLFGFPMTGKTTLFRLLTGLDTPEHHGVRGEVHLGVARVPDPRLDRLTKMYEPRKVTPATIDYVDLAGIEKGQAGDVLPLDQLRNAEALAHVVRSFQEEAVAHSEGSIDAARDVATMETELVLADHTIAERRVEKLEMLVMKANRDDDKKELQVMRKCLAQLDQGLPLRNVEFDEPEKKLLRGYTFLSRKPLLIVVNADEGDAEKLDDAVTAFGLSEFAGHPATEIVALSVKIEAEIAELDAEDAASFRKDLGIHEPALDRMIRASYHLLDRISFFTAGDKECRAWTVRRDTPAARAAGAIHEDMERGFIRAEVTSIDDLIEAGSWSHARELGKLRLEGKTHVIQDGDVVEFRFNV